MERNGYGKRAAKIMEIGDLDGKRWKSVKFGLTFYSFVSIFSLICFRHSFLFVLYYFYYGNAKGHNANVIYRICCLGFSYLFGISFFPQKHFHTSIHPSGCSSWSFFNLVPFRNFFFAFFFHRHVRKSPPTLKLTKLNDTAEF